MIFLNPSTKKTISSDLQKEGAGLDSAKKWLLFNMICDRYSDTKTMGLDHRKLFYKEVKDFIAEQKEPPEANKKTNIERKETPPSNNIISSKDRAAGEQADEERQREEAERLRIFQQQERAMREKNEMMIKDAKRRGLIDPEQQDESEEPGIEEISTKQTKEQIEAERILREDHEPYLNPPKGFLR